MPAISIVIPTLNEAKELPETLRRAKSLDGLKEIIVVDAGSTDSTQDIAREAGCMTLECEPSRGRQLCRGLLRIRPGLLAELCGRVFRRSDV